MSMEHMIISVLPFTGAAHSIACRSTTTLGQFQHLIAKRTGVEPARQSLLFRNDNLSCRAPDCTLASLGLSDGCQVGLYVLARSGPCDIVFPTVDTPSCSRQCPPEVTTSMESLIFEEGEVKTRAVDNLRTMGRVKELRHSLAQRKGHSSHRDRTPEPMMSPPLNVRPSRMSAPEDTSAKESSAGEYDDFGLPADEDLHTPRIRPTIMEQEKHYSPPPDVLSSSSEQDSKNVCGDDELDKGDKEQELTDDASGYSSGMFICNMAYDMRRLRVRKKHDTGRRGNAVISKSRTRATPLAIDERLYTHQHCDSSTDDEALRPTTNTNTQRCNMCGYRLLYSQCNITCRCGKTLCPRHRGSHTCGRRISHNHFSGNQPPKREITDASD